MIDPKILGPTDRAFHERLDKVEDRLVKVEERLDKVEERLVKVEDRLDKVDERLVKVDERLDKIDRKLEMIISVLQEHTELLKRLSVN